MSQPLRSRRRRYLRYLALELGIVVLGVSISLLLNEWRQQRADRAEEVRILESFATDLRVDLEDLQRRMEVLQDAGELMQKVRTPSSLAELDEAQRDQAMDAALGYIAFRPTRATYLEMQQTGDSSLIRDKELLHALIGLYERGYPAAREWDDINRNFVLERMFPFVDEYGPAFASDVRGAFARDYHKVLDALQTDDRFRNLLRSSAMFKEGQRIVYGQVVEALERILERVQAQLGEG